MKLRVTAALAAALLGTTGLAACSTGSDAEATTEKLAFTKADKEAFPVTIKHALGTTRIEEEPKRVVTIGWAEHDFVLSLGVVPVGASKISWGGEENGSTAWFDEELEELGAEAPVRIDDTAGINVEEIMKLDPDLVLATGWDVPKDVYAKLSKQVDVVAYETAPYTATWEESLETIGKALGRTSIAEEVQEETDAEIAAVAAENPQVKGKTFLFGGIDATNVSKIDYLTEHDPRSALLIALGMQQAPSVKALNPDLEAFYGDVSAENADTLESDYALFIPYAPITTAAFTKLVEGDPLLSKIPAVARGAWFTETNFQHMMALSSPTPLSIPAAFDGTLGDFLEFTSK